MFEDSIYTADRQTAVDRWFADPQPYLISRWIFLRALGAILFSAFYALYFQIEGLIRLSFE